MKWLWFFLSLRGRIGRKPYWIYMLATFGGGIFAALFLVYTGLVDPDFVSGGFVLLTLWPTLAVNVKRWHDRDKTAWWFVFLTLPWLYGLGNLVGLWILIECTFFSGSIESNRFGPSPMADLNPAGKADRFQPALIAVLLSLTMLGICFHSYRLPAGSMMPTLLVGDFIIVDRTAYGIPMPFTNRQVKVLKIPSRGDIVVFRLPEDPSIEYIKRVVGIPGDRIGYYDKILFINGESAEQVHLGTYIGKGYGVSMSGASERKEMLDDKQHKILVMPETPGVEGEYLVQDGEYFVMGDNRDNSNDSRYWGAVPEENLIGKASGIWMNWDSVGGGVEWERVGTKIQ